MQRPIFEWSGIAFTFVALGGFVFWVVSAFSDVADFELAFGGGSSRVEVAASDGQLLFCDSLANLEIFDIVNRGLPFNPPITADWAWDLPGLRLRGASFGDVSTPMAWSIWSAQLSCLIPSVIAALLATVCFLRLRAIRRKVLASRAANS